MNYLIRAAILNSFCVDLLDIRLVTRDNGFAARALANRIRIVTRAEDNIFLSGFFSVSSSPDFQGIGYIRN